jgi:hypothetical protein
MYRLPVVFVLCVVFISCSKSGSSSNPSVVIPDNLEGVISEISLTPKDLNTPDKGDFFISSGTTNYKVTFNAADQSSSNAFLVFENDTILTDQSREYANLGKDVISYNPVKENLVTIFFNDGKKVTGSFDLNTSFGGVFGEAVISQWRDPNDPSKPTQKAKDDLMNLVKRYADKDGPGPETARQYLIVTVAKR